jgi:predicted amino acid-binding ACT domain protein
MELPEDDVGVELMNQRFSEMGILVADEDGYKVSSEFLKRIHEAVLERLGQDVEVTSSEYRQAILEELKTMGIPAGFEEVLTNWVVHAKRIEQWE